MVEKRQSEQHRQKQEASNLLKDVKKLGVGYKVFSLVDKPKAVLNSDGKPQLLTNRTCTLDILYNMMSANCIELTEKIYVSLYVYMH